MRLLSITAGAANMYCGSCLCDNALAAELLARGHDVLLVPLYTPTLTDEPNVSDPHVFYGGISVYLQQHLPLFRRTPRVLDRLWDSRFMLKAAARGSISVNPATLGDLTISVLKGEHGHQRKELLKLVKWLDRQPRPDVVILPNSLLIGLAEPLGAALGRPVCCTLQGEDLFLDGLPEPHRTEALTLIRERVPKVDQFFAVSRYYVDFMAEYLRIPREKIALLPLGINLDDYPAERLARADDRTPFTVGYFARIVPEKGLHTLCDAYRQLRERHRLPTGRLDVAGYLAPEHRSYLASVERQMAEWGLDGEFQYHGTLDKAQKIRFLQRLDVLSVPGSYPDPKGMFALEAMASGVPVVQPRHGAFPEMLEKTGGGMLVDPGDAGRLADALATVYREPDRTEQLRRQGVYGVRKHYSVARMADRALELLEALIGRLTESQVS